MTLTLEDVQNVRFPIAKRVGEGYRATEVDDFVDRVDATFGTMLEENERLKAQLDSVGNSAQAASTGDRELAAENQRLKEELARARQSASAQAAAPAADNGELERLRRENADLRGQLEQARQSTGLTVMDGNQNGNGRVEKIVVSTAAQASPAVTRLVQLATEQAEAVVADARHEAERTVEEANRQAHEVTVDAQTRAERIQSEARVNADQLTAQARANSEALNADVTNRRREMFSSLEGERDQLVSTVEKLRAFEASYRATMAKHFRSQLEAIEATHLEPAGAPTVVGGGQQQAQGGNSSTPRLDALLGDN